MRNEEIRGEKSGGRRTGNLLEHGQHALVVVVVQEPDVGILQVLLERN